MAIKVNVLRSGNTISVFEEEDENKYKLVKGAFIDFVETATGKKYSKRITHIETDGAGGLNIFIN